MSTESIPLVPIGEESAEKQFYATLDGDLYMLFPGHQVGALRDAVGNMYVPAPNRIHPRMAERARIIAETYRNRADSPSEA